MDPFETHLTPLIALAQNSLVVNYISVHYFSLQTGVFEVADVAQTQTPSVPYTQPSCNEYVEHGAYAIQAVPDVVQVVEAENAAHPVCVDVFVVASEHYCYLQVPDVEIPVEATHKHAPSVPGFLQAIYVV